MNSPRFYTLQEAADIIGCSKSVLYAESREGRLPPELGAIRIGNRTFFPKVNLDRLSGETPE